MTDKGWRTSLSWVTGRMTHKMLARFINISDFAEIVEKSLLFFVLSISSKSMIMLHNNSFDFSLMHTTETLSCANNGYERNTKEKSSLTMMCRPIYQVSDALRLVWFEPSNQVSNSPSVWLSVFESPPPPQTNFLSNFILILCSQLTSLRQNILVRRFARFTTGLISYKKRIDKNSNLLLHEKRGLWTDANLKTVRANFLTTLHRTWVWWTRTKKKKLYWFLVQNLETIVWKKKEEEKEKWKKKRGKQKNGKMNLSCMNWRKLFWMLHSTK